jgi:hypothetical protein
MQRLLGDAVWDADAVRDDIRGYVLDAFGGTTKLSHLEDAIAASEVTLTGAEVTQLEHPFRPHVVLGHS